jgi:hypothetical protein
MNNKRLDELARRKQALISKASQDRANLAAACDKIRASVNFNQLLLGIGQALKSHPLLTVSASSILVSGLAGKLLHATGQAVAFSRLAVPLWSWLKVRRKAS